MELTGIRRFASEKTLFVFSSVILFLMPASEIVAEILSHYYEMILPSIFHPFFFCLFGIIGTLVAVFYKCNEFTAPETRGKWYSSDIFYLLNSETPMDFLGYFFLFYAGSRISSSEYRKKLIVFFLIIEAAHGIFAFFQTFDIQITYCLLNRHSGAAYGLTPNSNFYGGLSIFMLACASGVFLFSELLGAKRSLRILFAVFSGFIFYTVIGSRARLVWAGVVVMVLFYLISGLVMIRSSIDRALLKRYFVRFLVLCAVFVAVFALTHLLTDFVSEEITRTQMEVDGKLDNGIGSDRLLLF